MSEHIKALFEGQDLSEEFKVKASAIMEAALDEQAKQIRESVEAELQEGFEAKVSERLEELESLSESYISEEVLPQVDKYLTAAVAEWLEENKLALEAGAKVEIAESFLTGLVGLAESHNLALPQGEFDKVSALESKIAEMQESLVSLKDSNIELQAENITFQKRKIVGDLTVNLSESQLEKFAPVASKVEFKDTEQFTAAVKSLVESYFPVEVVEDVEIEEEVKPAQVIKESYESKLLSRVLS
jgi:hypothetical protein